MTVTRRPLHVLDFFKNVMLKQRITFLICNLNDITLFDVIIFLGILVELVILL